MFVLKYLYVFVKLKSMSCQIWPKSVALGVAGPISSKQRHIANVIITSSFIEGVNIYIYIYLIYIVHAYAEEFMNT